MADKGYRVYGYRWVVLAVFMFINITIQILWISFAPVIDPAAKFYGATAITRRSFGLPPALPLHSHSCSTPGRKSQRIGSDWKNVLPRSG